MRSALICAAGNVLFLWATAEISAQSPEDRRCLACHAQERIATDSPEDLRLRVRSETGQAPTPRKNQAALFTPVDSFSKGVHSGVRCVQCHPDAGDLPHAARLKPANCAACHSKSADEFLASAHADAQARQQPQAPNCASCHGTHDIRPKSDANSLTHPLKVIETCGSCHQQHTAAPGGPKDGKAWVQTYLDSVHGRAVREAGLVVAATCSDCHGHHDVRASRDPKSSVHRAAIPRTCGKCHVGIEKDFEGSVHAHAAEEAAAAAAAGLSNGLVRPKGSRRDMPPPVCSDCHASHAITRAESPGFVQDVIAECGTCHEDLYRTYRESYHGQVQRLGSPRAARCSSCHGAHNIRKASDPLSMLATGSIADTCARCHPEVRELSLAGRANFVRYAPHADYHDRQNHPILYYVWLYFMVLMSVTFTFWGLHSVAWFARGAILRARQGPAPRHHRGAFIKRFSAWHRVTHALVIISFMGLTLTGLPLKFSDQEWARPLMALVGGPETAGGLHRVFAVLVLLYLAMHFIHIIKTFADGNTPFMVKLFGPHSMLPMRRDWDQFVQMTRWFFGYGEKPRFDRWTYWEKFDYWADMVGTFIIGGSGLLLWFPAFFSEYFSGYWFNVATVIHGYEALLAVGFIFSIHFFNAHLRWEKFPVDDVIFTGRVPEAEFAEERAEQYARMQQEGTLTAKRVETAPAWQGILARIVAVISLTVGIALIVLIAWAGLR